MSLLPLVKLWLWISVLATVAGWTLSAVGQLNRLGYVLFFFASIVVLWLLRKTWAAGVDTSSFRWQKFFKRFRRPLPLAFIFLTFLILLGAILYPPTNHTAMTYRIPRVLQWLAHGHWFWIHTPDYRMNNRACGIEWLSAPLLLFTKSDRSLFLLNFFPFLLMPGLTFSLFTRLGVHPRVAWQWMWLLPTGYTFLLQAGSAGNDTFPTVYALAAVDFACRAWTSGRRSDVVHSLMAAALLTGAKASNLPLLLPWLVAWAPLFFWRKPVALGKNELLRWWRLGMVAVTLLALLVSFLPTAILNFRYCGDWSGLNLERAGMEMKNPIVGLWGNSLLFLLDNLVPPFFPSASWWNQNALNVLPHAITAPLIKNFENSFHWLWELPTEDWVGIGFGLSWLVIFVLVAAMLLRSKPSSKWVRCDAPPHAFRRVVLWAGWVALAAYCMKSGMSTGARLISPYYPFLLPLLLVGARQALLVRTRLWRGLVSLVMLLSIPVLILTPARPLWPAKTILAHLHDRYPDRPLIARGLNAYSVYATRSDPLAIVRSLLPANLTVVGFIARGDEPDISFWRPFGKRRVEHLLLTDSATDIRQRGIEYVVAGDFYFFYEGTSFAAWKQQTGAELVATTNATIRVSEGPQPWYIVRFSR